MGFLPGRTAVSGWCGVRAAGACARGSVVLWEHDSTTDLERRKAAACRVSPYRPLVPLSPCSDGDKGTTGRGDKHTPYVSLGIKKSRSFTFLLVNHLPRERHVERQPDRGRIVPASRRPLAVSSLYLTGRRLGHGSAWALSGALAPWVGPGYRGHPPRSRGTPSLASLVVSCLIWTRSYSSSWRA